MEKFKEVTLWYKEEMIMDTEAEDFEGFLHSGKSKFVFNHLEDSIVPIHQEIPKPIKPEFKEQFGWVNFKWAKQSAYLVNGTVVPISNKITIDEYGKLEFIKE